MIDEDRLKLIDTGDGVPLSKCEQNLYEVLACQEDGVPYDPQRIYDAFEDMNGLVAEVKRLREELKQTRESLWWCYDNYRFDGHPMTDVDWNFIGNLLGADMESGEE